jgi:hypothetical protein
MKHSTLRSFIAGSTAITVATVVTSAILLLSASPLTAAAQPAQPAFAPSITVDQVRDSFISHGYQVDQPHTWDWMSPPFTSFQVHDQTNNRVLMVLVYANSAAAHTARLQAQANENAQDSGSAANGPHLVDGYGPSAWNGNVGLVQTTQSELDRLFQAQIDRSNDLDVDSNAVLEPSPPSVAVDFDFQLALDNSAVNL